jgi:hypothetical protein
MIIIGIVFFVAVIAVVAYVFVRGSTSVTLDEQDFGEAYDELVTKGEIPDDDRGAAWQDYRAWQQEHEADRRSWEEAADE